MFRFSFLSLIIFVTLAASGQKLETTTEILLQSRHVWRGSQLGNAISIEPSVTLSNKRFSFNFWAAVTPNNSYSEIDLIPSWQFEHFSLTLLDYYNPVLGESNQYLNFQEGKNRHSLEVNIGNYSIEKQRFKWMIGTFFAGDRNDKTGKAFYSTYLEFKYHFTILGIKSEPFAGLTPFRGWYADKFAFVNTGVSFSKDLDLKLPFSVPLNLSFIQNPYSKQRFVIFAGGIAF